MFQANRSYDYMEALFQHVNYVQLTFTSERLFHNVEKDLAKENLDPETLQILRQSEARLREQLNAQLEDMLNMIGFFDTYDGIASFRSVENW